MAGIDRGERLDQGTAPHPFAPGERAIEIPEHHGRHLILAAAGHQSRTTRSIVASRSTPSRIWASLSSCFTGYSLLPRIAAKTIDNNEL